MTEPDRKRLAAILGMLGSSSAGERDNAARLAEQFRIQHGVQWPELVDGKTIYLSREIIVEKPVYYETVREVVRKVPARFLGFPAWLVAVWSLAIGFEIALGTALPMCH